MAVEGVVNFLMRKIDSFLAGDDSGEGKLLKEVHKIRGELEIMRAFLRDAEAKSDSEEVMKTWVKQVREAAYDIEDVLDEYELIRAQEMDHHAHNTAVDSHRKDGNSSSKHRKAIKRLINQVQELTTQVVDIYSRRERYKFDWMEQGSASNTQENRTSALRSIARFSKEDDLVGIDNPRNELIKWLVGGDSRLTTIALAGMGGLGKTTLAGKVYYSKEVKAHFKCGAWVTVSQSFKLEDIFRSMVKEFCGSSVTGLDRMGTDKLLETLEEFLQEKRYIIVLDDLWKTDDWELIKIGFPDGEAGSRIIVTTRINEVAAYCAGSSHIYNLHPLSFEDGWTLFCRKAFRIQSGGSYLPDLEELSKKIVKRCGGLPLAIVAIGGLLSTKRKTPIEWQNVYDRLGYEIEFHPTLNTMNMILSLSINDLPYNLKSCLFYLSIFPEDYSIRRMRLIRLWIAEGFVGQCEGETLEDVAHNYFQELINRSLIQVAEHTDYGKVRGCRVHDIVREMILLKSKESNFVTPFLTKNMIPVDEIRRLSIDNRFSMHMLQPFCIKGSTWKNDSLYSFSLWRLRSLMIFSRAFDLENNFPFSKLRFLKVLDLEGAGWAIRSFPIEIMYLSLLRFLSFRGTAITEVLPAIGSLRNLQTLDLRNTKIKELPTDIAELKHLRHLLAFSSAFIFKSKGAVEVKHGVIGSLRSLQELVYIDVEKSRGVVREVGMLTQLRKLGIRNLPTEDGMDLCVSIDKLECLCKLHVSSTGNGRDLLELESVSSPPPLLQHLVLKGHLEKLPHWIPSVVNLTYLELQHSALKEDVLKALQHLPSLMVLKLDRAYQGTEFCVDRGGLQRLTSLSLYGLHSLKMVRVAEGAMPCLRKLKLEDCNSLEKVPLGIEFLTQIKELELKFASSKLLRSISSNGGQDLWKISHIPIRRYSECWETFYFPLDSVTQSNELAHDAESKDESLKVGMRKQ